jgi:hypothetical protein
MEAALASEMTLCGQRYVIAGTWTTLSAGKVETPH